MKNVQYDSLKLQHYFKDSKLSVENKCDIFFFRTRMADFGENFRGHRNFVVCPFVCNQCDSQSHTYTCLGIGQKVDQDFFSKLKNKIITNVPNLFSFAVLSRRLMERSCLGCSNFQLFHG